MSYNITLIPGDGIGPEVTDAVTKVIEAAGVKINWEVVPAGIQTLLDYGTALPEITLESIKRNGIALKGPVATPVGEGYRSINVEIRKRLNLYANLRPTKSFPNVKSRYEGVDLVVIRENTEDVYSGLEHIVTPGVAETLKVVTKKASLKIARFAFDYARKRGRKKITVIHKANIMKLSDGLFLECVRRVAKGTSNSNIKYEELIVDNACMQLVLDPYQFDVLLTSNLYGDIISDLCAGLVGGLGLAPGANIGDRYAVFESVHGTAPDIAGKNLANPIAIILSGVMMLEQIGEIKVARRIESAIAKVLEKGEVLTRDLGGDATTNEMRDAIIMVL